MDTVKNLTHTKKMTGLGISRNYKIIMSDFIYEVAVLSNQKELNKERNICIALRCVFDLKFNRECRLSAGKNTTNSSKKLQNLDDVVFNIVCCLNSDSPSQNICLPVLTLHTCTKCICDIHVL